jgi:hypothetical protein
MNANKATYGQATLAMQWWSNNRELGTLPSGQLEIPESVQGLRIPATLGDGLCGKAYGAQWV